MAYPGGKNGSGVYQKIINLMPPHPVYIEPFLGGGAIMRLKRPAKQNIGLDLHQDVIDNWTAGYRTAENNDAGSDTTGIDGTADNYQFINQDAIQYLKEYDYSGDELIYCDPPYMHETRTSLDLYDFEMSDAQHIELLDTLLNLNCKVMISGYWTELYAEKLKGWSCINFQAMTRAGKTATEYLWFNFPEPTALHDYRYLGKNYRERERISRKKNRWINKLKTMPLLERQALLCAMDEAWPTSS